MRQSESISDKATVCPYCGYSVMEISSRKKIIKKVENINNILIGRVQNM